MLAIDQHALGTSARCVWAQGDLRLFEKELEDGGQALGCVTLGPAPAHGAALRKLTAAK